MYCLNYKLRIMHTQMQWVYFVSTQRVTLVESNPHHRQLRLKPDMEQSIGLEWLLPGDRKSHALLQNYLEDMIESLYQIYKLMWTKSASFEILWGKLVRCFTAEVKRNSSSWTWSLITWTLFFGGPAPTSPNRLRAGIPLCKYAFCHWQVCVCLKPRLR